MRRRPKLDPETNKLRERSHGLLWFGTWKDGWSITDPWSPELEAAMKRLRPDVTLDDPRDGSAPTPATPEEEQRRADLYRVLRVVDDYAHLTTYGLGIEHMIKKLRIIWRALREGRER